MYCRNCGEQLSDYDRVCPACGTPVDRSSVGGANAQNESANRTTYQDGPQTYQYNGAEHQTYNYSGPEYQGSYDSGSPGWGVLGCCIPLVGLILFLVWKDSKPRSAKAAGIGALIGVIAIALFYVMFLILGLSLGALVSSGEFDFSEIEDILDESIRMIVNGATF
ncbi:MAG: zinc-ribbon domain-containing protein [Firmicutes bacterium]|nr:zinc-ribbon domain-containing protein [Bacillota bacterium]